MKKKKIWLVPVALLCLLIPLGITLLIIMQNLSSDPAKGTVSALTLSFADQVERVEDTEEIDFFITAAKSGSPIEKAAHDLSEYRRMDVVFHKLNHDVSYVFYLSDSENDCVYSDAEGNFFLFPSEFAKTLQSHSLLGGFGLSFSYYPSVCVDNRQTAYFATKAKGEWTYTDPGGKVKKEEVSYDHGNTAVLSHGEDLNLTFSIEPDYCSILLLNEKGEILYSGKQENMEKLLLEEDQNLTLSVSCDWYENEERDYFGSIEYEFDLFYDLDTLCEWSATEAKPGETLTLRVLHSSSSKIAVNPTFATDRVDVKKVGDAWEATISVSPSAKSGSYSVLVMGSDVEESFAVTILPAA